MNPSPTGGFLSGIAGGISGGMESYVKLVMAGIDRKQKEDWLTASRNQDIFSDPNQPLPIRKKAFELWLTKNKDWNTGIEVGDFPDEMWEDKKLDPYFKRAINIRNNKNLTKLEQVESVKGIIEEAGLALGLKKAAPLKPVLEGLQTGAFKMGAGRLGKTGLTPEIVNLLGETKTGRGMVAERLKPIKKKTPAISQYKTMSIGGGKFQEMEWNPETGKHDKPYGKPTSKPPTYMRLGSTIYEIKEGESTALQKGSSWERATINAMREPNWLYLSEAEQFLLIEKHERLILGTPGPMQPEPPTPPEQPTGLLDKAIDWFAPKQAEDWGTPDKPEPKPTGLVPKGTPLTKGMARKFWKAAGGNRALAEKMAIEAGYSLPKK